MTTTMMWSHSQRRPKNAVAPRRRRRRNGRRNVVVASCVREYRKALHVYFGYVTANFCRAHSRRLRCNFEASRNFKQSIYHTLNTNVYYIYKRQHARHTVNAHRRTCERTHKFLNLWRDASIFVFFFFFFAGAHPPFVPLP